MSSTLLCKASIALFALLPCASLAQQTFVTCWDDLQKQTNYRFHRQRGPVLTNAHGWQVYVDAEARPAKLASGNCINTSRIMLRGPKGVFRPVYITRPEEYMLGSYVDILGWAEDKLLFFDMSFQYGSDAYSHQVVIFDASTGAFSMPDLGKMVAGQLQLKCDLDPVAKGWSNGKVLFAVADMELGNDDAGCMEGKPKVWVFNPNSLTVSVAPQQRAR